MATANNKVIGRRFLELVSDGNVVEICEMISPSWKMHTGFNGLQTDVGPEGIRKLFQSFGKIKQEWTIQDIIAENDKVVVRATNTCLQERFFDIPSNGREQTFTAMFIHHIKDGKIEETWRNADDLGRVLQLGAELRPAGHN
jgi:predicted SnoaL-like aldol condensation-catalyzing enzyme